MAFWTRKPKAPRDPEELYREMKTRIQSGQRLHTDQLTPEELAAAGRLVSQGLAKFGSAACHPVIEARLR